MKHKLLSHTQGECFRELCTTETPDVCVDCAMLLEVFNQFLLSTDKVEQIPDLIHWLKVRKHGNSKAFQVRAVIHFIRNLGFHAIKVKFNKLWHVYLYMDNVRFGGHAETFEAAYDEAIGGYFNILCGMEQKEERPRPKRELRPSVH